MCGFVKAVVARALPDAQGRREPGGPDDQGRARNRPLGGSGT